MWPDRFAIGLEIKAKHIRARSMHAGNKTNPSVHGNEAMHLWGKSAIDSKIIYIKHDEFSCIHCMEL
jgi:hypothetical protein